MVLVAFSPYVLVLIPGFIEWTQGITDPVVGTLATIPVHVIPALTGLLCVWLLMRFVDRRPIREAGWRFTARTVPLLLLGTVLAALMVLLVSLPLDAAGLSRPAEGADRALWLALVLGLSQGFVLQAFPEELVWRGYFLQTLQTRPQVSVLISALLFALMHVVSVGGQESAFERVVYLFLPFGFAVLAGALVVRTGSLWAAVGVHGGVHVGTLILTLFFGIGEGPAYWAVGGGVFTIVGLALLFAPARRGS